MTKKTFKEGENEAIDIFDIKVSINVKHINR